jgi:UPF0755 protein
MMKRPAFYSTCLFLLITVFCLGAILAGWVMFKLPADAERAFGPPSTGLGMFERSYLSALLLMQVEQLKQPGDALGDQIAFQVQLGESTYEITENLQGQGLIVNASALRDYLVYAGMDTTIQAGEYTLSPGMTSLEIAHTLQDATPSEVTFRILPGWRLEEIAAALPTSGLEISSQTFLGNAANPPLVSPLVGELPSGASLEGFLFPDSYRLPRQIAVDGFIRTLLENFEIKVEHEIREGFQNQGLDLYQAVTLASIVEREAVMEDEMPMIASVFLNRLNVGMKLETDPTVQYALGFNRAQGSWWTNPLSLKDLKFVSPYNTYLYSGLPPGPIANPSLSALRAVAFPAQTPYYYFRSTCDGSGRHTFAETFEEHQANACEQ